MACWKGYTQKGMKKKGDRIVPNCVKKEDRTIIQDAQGNAAFEVVDLITADPIQTKASAEETDLTGPQWNKMVSNRQLGDISKKRSTIHKEFDAAHRKQRKAMKEGKALISS